ncbi:MAG: hypothetical protein IPJ84_19245 [Bdellovibrionales bacterium]|nr:hypothetical protein [Bdellovibrionales bacterium]
MSKSKFTGHLDRKQVTTRSEALDLAEQFKSLHHENGYSVETMVRAIAMQAAIFEKINTVLWNEAIADAKAGLSLALPETNN